MGLLESIKTRMELWRIEKYTKRRPVASPDFEQKDLEFYKQNYQNGVYLHQTSNAQGQSQSSPPRVQRKTTLLRQKSERIVRSSENYNNQ